ncbi:cell wall-binding protein [Desulfosporosinus orientis DSM 765]|uniref:Cell wall-binding protein n=1 Tax=Desulfosporosinus orientis (strain ATCC 19365 / DSM 765 / NCIMB 8382 / VKM B-1628 / Singapore I) TaxID=768706 RepID=G7WJJ4_DESOD|nr:cell wall-binding repeat-containing protein [Desulfosporosinus orientis]AET70431.1 cell wall-binding protein [Desulfosporosinus orientis DSM 765]
MGLKKRAPWIGALLSLLLVLTGCSQNQQVIFDAAMKMQDVTSLEQQTTLTFNLSGAGFDSAVQQQVDMASSFLNNAQLDFDSKTTMNQEKTVAKAQVEMNLSMQGMTINMPVWVDSDFSGDTPKLKEVVKLPQVAAASLPSQFAKKEYMVLNPFNMGSANPSSFNFSNLAGLSSLQSQQIDFLTSYAKRFNPDVKVVSKGSQYVETNDGRKLAKIYEVKLNDAELKELIRYTVNNFAQDKEAMTFVKTFMHSILGMNQSSSQGIGLSEFDEAFAEFEENKDEFLDSFNTVMDQLKDVTLLGDQGIELQYAIANGYVVKESGTIDLKVDLAQISKIMAAPGMDEESIAESGPSGTLNLKIDFSTVTSNINKPIDIQIPEVNDTNSFDYMDLMNSMIQASRPERLAGQDSYMTARRIAEEYNGGQCDTIILVSGLNFADALSSSILSKQDNAPVLLVGATVEDSQEAFDYIAMHANPDTKFIIIGGTGIISPAFEAELSKDGYGNVDRLSGVDRYETAMAVVDKANIEPGTPVVVVSGESFPDALSAVSLVAKQYPILLVSHNELPERTKTYLLSSKPAAVYIVGGTAAVSQSVEAQIQELAPSAEVKRLAGNTRFDTAGAVLSELSTNPGTIYLANGFNYSDGIAGSALAAKNGDPILLINPSLSTLPPATEAYLKTLRDSGSHPMIRALGGEAAVPDTLVEQAQSIFSN